MRKAGWMALSFPGIPSSLIFLNKVPWKPVATQGAVRSVPADSTNIKPRQIKRIMRPMIGFKSTRCAHILLAGIETMHMIHKD